VKKDPHESKMENTAWYLPGSDGLCADGHCCYSNNTIKAAIQPFIS